MDDESISNSNPVRIMTPQSKGNFNIPRPPFFPGINLPRINVANWPFRNEVLALHAARMAQMTAMSRNSPNSDLQAPIIHTSSGKKLFQCPQCSYVTDRKNNLKRHISTMHHECDKILECCEILFKNKADLRDHVNNYHRSGYKCGTCGRNFCRKALLKRHLLVHNSHSGISPINSLSIRNIPPLSIPYPMINYMQISQQTLASPEKSPEKPKNDSIKTPLKFGMDFILGKEDNSTKEKSD